MFEFLKDLFGRKKREEQLKKDRQIQDEWAEERRQIRERRIKRDFNARMSAQSAENVGRDDGFVNGIILGNMMNQSPAPYYEPPVIHHGNYEPDPTPSPSPSYDSPSSSDSSPSYDSGGSCDSGSSSFDSGGSCGGGDF